MSVPALRGSEVVLRPMTYDDTPLLMKWGSDPAFRHYQWGQKPGAFEEKNARAWIERMSRPGDSACWVIEHRGRPIGFANYRDFHPKGKSADIGIGIGEPELWGKHLGRDALTALLRYLFDDLGLHRVGLSVVGFNDRAISMSKAVGFELEGQHVRLVPLRMEHAQALLEAADEDDIWRWMVPRPKGLDGYERYIRWALDQQILGAQLPFAVIRKSDGVLVGTTRYAHIDPPNRTIEIGYTLYGKDARRTPVNTECKLLLLRHAFETLGANRVWLQTDKRNERSQNAIARLGATKEGELRNERLLADGHLRTSVIFGITKDEWPAIRKRLLDYLAR